MEFCTENAGFLQISTVEDLQSHCASRLTAVFEDKIARGEFSKPVQRPSAPVSPESISEPELDASVSTPTVKESAVPAEAEGTASVSSSADVGVIEESVADNSAENTVASTPSFEDTPNSDISEAVDTNVIHEANAVAEEEMPVEDIVSSVDESAEVVEENVIGSTESSGEETSSSDSTATDIGEAIDPAAVVPEAEFEVKLQVELETASAQEI